MWVDAGTLTEAAADAIASTFIEIMADVNARAEVEVCVAGDQVSSTTAWSNCFAKACNLIVHSHCNSTLF